MKFLFTTLPSNDLGLLTRSLPIANELRINGHEILFSNPAAAPSVLIEEAGFKNLIPRHPLYQIRKLRWNHLFNPNIFKDDYGNIIRFSYKLIRALPTKFAPITAEVWDMDHGAAMIGMMNENFVRANCEAYEELIVDTEADIIVDFWNPFACIASKILNKPLITVIQADAHPDNKGVIWWKERPKNLPTALPTINKVIVSYGLKKIGKVEELSIGDLTLVVGTPDLDPIPEGANCNHIGPLLWEKADDQLPEWIETISRSKPLIWVYPGNPRYGPKETVFDSEIIIRACIHVLSKMDAHVILTTGNHKLPKDLLPLPDNFYSALYLPGLQLAKKCDLMIHHGGYGSCQTSLYSGTPSVIIPTFSERESNARRVAAVGAGEFVLPKIGGSSKREIDLKEFREKINRVLLSPSYLLNSQLQGQKMASFGGPEKAVNLIEGFVSSFMRVT